MVKLRQQRLERLAPPAVTARGQGADGVAVIALPAADDVLALRLADLEEILARQLERRLDALGAAGVEIHALDAGRRTSDDMVRKQLGYFGREERSVRVGKLIELALDRGDDARMTVPKAGYGCPTRGIEVALAILVVKIYPLPAHGDGQVGTGVPLENVWACGHGYCVM